MIVAAAAEVLTMGPSPSLGLSQALSLILTAAL